MIPTRIYFNRPGAPVSIQALLGDLAHARSRIAIACAWFTRFDVVETVIAARAREKLIVLNAADLYRHDGQTAHGHKVAQRFIQAREEEQRGCDWHLYALGSEAYRDGIMHHKFVVVDSKITWTGSYNLTYQAGMNYETLMRFDDPDIAQAFDDELLAMIESPDAQELD